jgi:hypothetical protein
MNGRNQCTVVERKVYQVFHDDASRQNGDLARFETEGQQLSES